MQKEVIFSKDILEQCLPTNVVKALTDVFFNQEITQVVCAAKNIAEVFGSADLFESLLDESDEDKEKNLISSFHRNLTLLIQKTWVEKADEVLKDQILYKLDEVCTFLEEKKYREVYRKYIDLLNDVVFLMFGNMSTNDDFYEYALRIDPGFGLFWCYLKTLNNKNPEYAQNGRIYIILGMLFLSNY